MHSALRYYVSSSNDREQNRTRGDAATAEKTISLSRTFSTVHKRIGDSEDAEIALKKDEDIESIVPQVRLAKRMTAQIEPTTTVPTKPAGNDQPSRIGIPHSGDMALLCHIWVHHCAIRRATTSCYHRGY
jgi:hypothetical protein